MIEIKSLYKRIVLLSPYVEVLFRKFYWKNIKYLVKFRPYGSGIENKRDKLAPINFEDILSYLKDQGVVKGDILIVHSSYDNLKGTGLKPNEINSKLKEFIGEKGTLAMPAIRDYKEYPNLIDRLSTDFSKIDFFYNPIRTPISSGMLPSMLLREKGAVISMHPLNNMVAVGPLAQPMMEHNLDGDKPTPHGPNSSWKYCADHNAVIVSLGVNMVHHLTMAHVAEDTFEDWPYKDWYNELSFKIVMPDKTIVNKIVRERKPRWGLFYDAELNFEKELYKAGVISSTEIGGVAVGVARAKELIEFIKNHKHKGFPYYKF